MVETAKQLRVSIVEKENILDGFTDAVVVENRALTPNEAKTYKDASADLCNLRSKLARLDDDPEPAEIESRGVRSKPPGQAPAVGRSRGDQKPYSLLRAIRLKADYMPLDGLEAEVHQEVIRRSDGRTFKGFAMPSSLSDPEMRNLMYPNVSAEAWERRDLTTTTGGGSIYTVPRGFIELLRSRLVVNKLGVNMMSDMKGNFALARQNGTNVVQWVGEGASASPTNLTVDNVVFTPKLAIATTIITKQLMMQSSIDAETRVNKDLAKVLALEFDRVVFNGSGGVQPLGILQDPTIQANSVAIQGGPAGAPITYAQLVRMKGIIASYNADVGNMAYVTNSTVETSLRLTNRQAAGQNSATFVPIWEDTAEPGVGRIVGMRAFATNIIPSNVTKGASANCSGIILGSWDELTVATLDTGVDVIIDPFTGKRSGAIEITTEMAMDSHPDHPESFCVLSDVIPT